MGLRAVFLTMLVICAQRAAAKTSKTKPLTETQLDMCKSVSGLKQLVKQTGVANQARPKGGAPLSTDAIANAAWMWIYGYPLLAMTAGAVSSTQGQNKANVLDTLPTLIGACEDKATGVVTTNSDTIYSIIWLDTSKGPLVLTAPKVTPSSRFYVLPLLDMYTEQYASYGSVTTGNGAGSWVVMPPGQHAASLPAQYAKLPRGNATTNGTWVIGRMYVTNQTDVPNVADLWKQFKVTPVYPERGTATQLFSTASKAYDIMGKPEPAAIGAANASAAYVALAGLMATFPPPLSQAPNVTKAIAAMGLNLRSGFSQAKLSAGQNAAMTAGYQLGFNCLESFLQAGNLGVPFNYGWSATVNGGVYGSNYLLRGAYALQGLGVQGNNVATYYNTNQDSQGRALTGANGTVYTITFDRPPPTNYFTSLTMYQWDNKFFVCPNPTGRVNIQFPRDTPALQKNKNGSLTLYISAAAPGPKGSLEYTNWLPSSPSPVYLILRVYGPKPEVFPDYKYQPPPFMKVKLGGMVDASPSPPQQQQSTMAVG